MDSLQITLALGKIMKVNENCKTKTISLLERGVITSHDEITHTFADHYANISKDLCKKSKPGKNRKKRSYHMINYSQTEN